MTTFTAEALLAFVLAHQCVPPDMAVPMVGLALHENPKLDSDAVNSNKNGTDDIGIGQVNTSNFGWTHLNRQTAREPCANIHASMMVLFARYNGNPPDFIKDRYARGAEAAVGKVGSINPVSEPPQEDKNPTPQGLHDAVHFHSPKIQHTSQESQ